MLFITHYIRIRSSARINLHPETRMWTTYWHKWDTGCTYMDLAHIDDQYYRCLATNIRNEDLVVLTLQGAILTDISPSVVSHPEALSLSLSTRILK